MSTPRLSDLRRRDFLRFAGSTAALLALAASPVAAFAQSQGGGAPLKIGTIGAGREGGALGTLFAKAGHPVMFSSRHPEQLKELVDSAGPNAKAGTVAEAIAFARCRAARRALCARWSRSARITGRHWRRKRS